MIAAWAASPRWNGLQPQITPRRARAIAAKRAWQANPVDLRACLSGAELLAGLRSGEAFPFPLEARRGREMMPAGARWTLRAPHRRVIALIAAAHLGFRARGLVASQGELGEALGMSARWVRELLAELSAWGLVHVAPTFVPYGKVTSQRANVYRLTTLAACVWRLVLPAGVGPLPEPVLRDRARAQDRKTLPPIRKPSASDSSGEQPVCQASEAPAEAPDKRASAKGVGELVRVPVSDRRSEAPTEAIRDRIDEQQTERKRAELAREVEERARRKPPAAPMPSPLPDPATLERLRMERPPVREQRPVRLAVESDELDEAIARAWSSWGSRRGGRS